MIVDHLSFTMINNKVIFIFINMAKPTRCMVWGSIYNYLYLMKKLRNFFLSHEMTQGMLESMGRLQVYNCKTNIKDA